MGDDSTSGPESAARLSLEPGKGAQQVAIVALGSTVAYEAVPWSTSDSSGITN